ncbi:hypothetical protein MBLNU459_g2647t1 [Dothideomycetes sp. NU459]
MYGDEAWEYHLYRDLYVSHGWPDHFNESSFDTGRQALQEAEDQRNGDKELLRKLEEAEEKDKLAEAEPAWDAKFRSNFESARDDLVKKLADVNIEMREQREFFEAKELAEQVEPAFRDAFEEWERKYGY